MQAIERKQEQHGNTDTQFDPEFKNSSWGYHRPIYHPAGQCRNHMDHPDTGSSAHSKDEKDWRDHDGGTVGRPGAVQSAP